MPLPQELICWQESLYRRGEIILDKMNDIYAAMQNLHQAQTDVTRDLDINKYKLRSITQSHKYDNKGYI